MKASASPLLDPAESAHRARPLRSWSDAQQDKVRLRFLDMLREWCAAWVPARDISIDEAEAHVGESHGATRVVDDIAHWSFETESAAAPQRGTSSTINAIANRMFAFDMAAIGAAHETPVIAIGVAHAAWDDWLRRIMALLGSCPVEPRDTAASRSPGGPHSSAWSGALSVRLPWCGGTWHLALPYPAVATLLGNDIVRPSAPPDALAIPRLPLDQALGEQRLGVRVMLAGAQLNLGQLQDLRLGDVVLLDQHLDAPVQVVTTDGTPVCDGWLGQSEGRIAVELAVTPNPNT